jgi:sugar O-acyltransferase (sialic acid O-acetyltransferase NeuD family)
MDRIDIGLLGSGGHADEVEATHGNVVFRAVSKPYMNNLSTVDIENPSEEQKNMPVNIAVGSPLIRKKMRSLWPGTKYETVVSRSASIENSSVIGIGCYLAHQSVVTTNASIGDHVIVGVGSSVHHDSVVGDFVTLSPGVRVGGRVRLGDGVFVGIGATITNGVNIADGVVVGAGATVIGDCLEENGVYVGVPARLIKTNKEWLSEI